jgi:hypothetical protein
MKTKYDTIKSGKVKWYFCKHPINERFAYLRSFHPFEIIEKEKVEVDYDEQFNKSILSIVNRFAKPIGLPEINKRLSVLSGLFNLDPTNNNETNKKSISNILEDTKNENVDFDEWFDEWDF